MESPLASDDYKIVVADIASQEPRILWTAEYDSDEYKFAESKIFRVKKAFGHGIAEEIDFATGATLNSFKFSK